MTTLSPGDTAPDFTLPDPDGTDVTPVRAARAQGRSSTSTRRPPRRAAPPRPATSGTTSPPCRAPATGCSASRRTPRTSSESSATSSTCRSRCCATRPARSSRRTARTARRSSTARRSIGVIRSTFVLDENGVVERAHVQRQGHRPRRQAPPRPRHRLSCARTAGCHRRRPSGAGDVYDGQPSGSGVTGSRAGFRFLCLRAWGFESPLPHAKAVPVASGRGPAGWRCAEPSGAGTPPGRRRRGWAPAS